VPESDINLHERSATRFAEITKPVMVALTDVGLSSTELDTTIGGMVEALHTFRPTAFVQQQAQKLQRGAGEPVSINGRDSSSAVVSIFGDDPTSAPSTIFPHEDE
jgi:hypothetical protein